MSFQTEANENKEFLTALIRRAMDGDEQAFENLMGMYARYILAYARNLTATAQDAEDAAQEIAIEVWRGIGRLESPFAFGAWLRRICFNVCMNYVDRLKRKQGNDVPIDEAEFMPEPDERKLAEPCAIEADEKTRLLAMIRALPDAQKSALFLYYYEERSYKEIAELQGIRVGTVATNIKKAKNNLKKQFEREQVLERKDKGLTKMNSAALGIMIEEAIRQDTEAFISEQAVSRFMARIREADKGTWGNISRISIRKPVASKTYPLLFLGLVVACICIVAAIFVLFSIEPSVSGEPPAGYIYDAVHAEIVFFSNNAKGEHVNPMRGELTVNDDEGDPVGWRVIADAAGTGTLVLSGEGAVADIPADLAPGMYTLSFDVVSGSAVSVVSRVFYVE